MTLARRQRLEGLRQKLVECGQRDGEKVSVDVLAASEIEEDVIPGGLPYEFYIGRQLTKEFLEHRTRSTALVGANDMISICARGGIDIYTIVDQLNSTGSCPSYAVRSATRRDTSKGACCPMAVGNALIAMSDEWRMANLASMIRPNSPASYHCTICCAAG